MTWFKKNAESAAEEHEDAELAHEIGEKADKLEKHEESEAKELDAKGGESAEQYRHAVEILRQMHESATDREDAEESEALFLAIGLCNTKANELGGKDEQTELPSEPAKFTANESIDDLPIERAFE